MKKFLTAIMAIALAATMIVASLVVVSAEENLAAGATYTIVRLTEGPGSSEEEGPAWINENNGDDVNFDRLTDGWNKGKESVVKSCLLAGTARTHRIVFDLGSAKDVSTVVLYMKDSYRREYQGKHAGNRGYNKDDGIVVYADKGNKALAATLTETAQLDAEGNECEDYYVVTLSFAAVNTQYITIDIQAEKTGKYPQYADDEDNLGAYVVSINEVEIFGGAAPVTPTTKNDDTKVTEPKGDTTKAEPAPTQKPATPTKAPTKPQDSATTPTGDSSVAIIAILSVLALGGAAVVLKKKSF